MFNSIIWASKYNNPVIIVENRMLYKNSGHVILDENYYPDIRKLEDGNDLTLISLSHTSLEASRAISALKAKGIKIDHFSLINLTNFSINNLLKSAKKTGKVLLVDNGWTKCSIVKDILCDMYIAGFRGECQILGYAKSPCPTPKNLENIYYPTPTSIAKSILALLKINSDIVIPESPEIKSFKGPFLMNYLSHQTEFGEEFNSKLQELENDLKNIYAIRKQNEFDLKERSIRLHSSTLDYKSTFACMKAILENKITMGALVKSYEQFYAQYIGGSYEVLSCNSGSSANLLAISTLVQSSKLKKGDKVIVPALSWSTTVFPLVQYGLILFFVIVMIWTSIFL